MLFDKSWEKLRVSLNKIKEDLESNSAQLPTECICEFLIVGEDHRFYKHAGVDPIALLRAAWKTIFCNNRQGGSTIAMQLVRTLTGNYELTIYRKIHEIVLAVRTTKYLGKKSIPTMYLWVAYYGSSMCSYRQACVHLGLKSESMTDMDASKLVARLKYPQPLTFNEKREIQIQSRALHLLKLRGKSNALRSTKGHEWNHFEFQRQ